MDEAEVQQMLDVLFRVARDAVYNMIQWKADVKQLRDVRDRMDFIKKTLDIYIAVLEERALAE